MNSNEFRQVVAEFPLFRSEHLATVDIISVPTVPDDEGVLNLQFTNPNLINMFSSQSGLNLSGGSPRENAVLPLCWWGSGLTFNGLHISRSSSGVFSLLNKTSNPVDSVAKDLRGFQGLILRELHRARVEPTLRARQDLSALYVLRVFYGYTRNVPYPKVKDFLTEETCAWLRAAVPIAPLLYKFVQWDQQPDLSLDNALRWVDTPQVFLQDLFQIG